MQDGGRQEGRQASIKDSLGSKLTNKDSARLAGKKRVKWAGRIDRAVRTGSNCKMNSQNRQDSKQVQDGQAE